MLLHFCCVYKERLIAESIAASTSSSIADLSFEGRVCMCWGIFFTSALLHPKHYSSKARIRSHHILLKQTALRG